MWKTSTQGTKQQFREWQPNTSICSPWTLSGICLNISHFGKLSHLKRLWSLKGGLKQLKCHIITRRGSSFRFWSRPFGWGNETEFAPTHQQVRLLFSACSRSIVTSLACYCRAPYQALGAVSPPSRHQLYLPRILKLHVCGWFARSQASIDTSRRMSSCISAFNLAREKLICV